MRLFLKIMLLFILTQLISCGGGGSSEVVDNNQAPIANAGADQEVNENIPVVLTGGATDVDGSVAKTQWQQTQGPSVEIADTSLLELRFTSPIVLASAGEQSLTFLLTVTDNEGASATDTVTIIVKPINEDPIANAGESQTFLITETITLDCGDSKDADSDIFTIEWLQISGEKAKFKQSNSCQSSVQLPAKAGDIEFQLNITDGDLITVSDTVVVTVKAYKGERTNLPNSPLFSSSNNVSVDFNLTQDDAFITHEEDVIYVSSKYNKRLTILDVTRSQAPSELSQLSFSGQPEGKLVIDGTRGFQLMTKNGQSVVVIIDLAVLEAPSILTEITSSDWLMNIEVNDNYIYAIDNKGLVIIDIADLTEPKQTTSIALGFTGFMINDQIKLDGNTLYTTNAHLLNVINISEPSNPELVKSLALDNKATQANQIGASALVIADKHLYINRYSDSYDSFGVSIFDIAAPHAPVFVGEIPAVGNNWDLAVHNNKAYVLASQFRGSYSWSFEWYTSWLDVYDLSDNANPLHLGEHELGNTPKLTVSDDVIYTIGAPLNIHDQPLFSEPLTDGNLAVAENESSITVVNNTAFIAKESNGIVIVDVTNSAKPSQLSTMITTGEVKALQNRDDTLFAGIQNGEKGLELYDIVEPITPKLLSKFGDSNNAVSSITFDNDIAYLSNISSYGLQLVNIEDKTAPALLASAGDSTIETVINGDFVTSLQRLNFIKFNLTNTSMPKIDYEMLSPIVSLSDSPVSLAAFNDNLYIITNDLENGSSCLLAVEFPHTDILRSSYCAKSTAGKIYQQGTLLFVPWGSLGIKTFDISSGTIELKAQYYGEHSITGVDVENGKVYVTDTEGLSIFDTNEHIIIEQNYYSASTSETLNYQLNWEIDYPIKFKCFVTAGSCTISINEETKTAQTTWALPDIAGDYEIAIVGGNNAFYNVHRDKVTIH